MARPTVQEIHDLTDRLGSITARLYNLQHEDQRDEAWRTTARQHIDRAVELMELADEMRRDWVDDPERRVPFPKALTALLVVSTTTWEEVSALERLMAEKPLDAYVLLSWRLWEIRLEAGLSQAELAAKIGSTVGVVQHVENNRRTTTLDIMTRWADACGYRLEINVVGKDADRRAASFFDLFQRLDDRERTMVLGITEALPHLPEPVQDVLEDQLQSWRTRYLPK